MYNLSYQCENDSCRNWGMQMYDRSSHAMPFHRHTHMYMYVQLGYWLIMRYENMYVIN